MFNKYRVNQILFLFYFIFSTLNYSFFALVSKICNPVSLCVECQRNVDLKDEKNFASVAGRVVLETSTAVSVLEESRSSDHNRTGDSRALNEALNETVETAPELPKALPPKRTMNLEEICKQQLVKKGYEAIFYLIINLFLW